MFVITNMTTEPLKIDGVSIDPKEQLSVSHLSPGMIVARDKGELRVLSGDETLEERKADTAAIDSFKP
jgi:hypothetical protein